MKPIFLKPVLQPKVWGGTKLIDDYHLSSEVDSDTIGEAWCISAHPNGVSQIISPMSYAHQGLDSLYRKQPDLFGQAQHHTFPLLVKVIDAKDNLSVQVHPDDDYAKEHEGELGKTECWYIMDADEGATIIYGHNALSKEEFLEKVEHGAWGDLLVEVPVKKGDFFYVPHGTVHAIGKGIVILETQQNSDTTYRVYDYNRQDKNGNTRDLHIQKAIDVIDFSNQKHHTPPVYDKIGNSTIITYVDNEFFKVEKYVVNTDLSVKLRAPYTLVTVIQGSGALVIEEQEYPLTMLTSFILPSGISQIQLQGNMEIILSSVPTNI